MKRITVVSCSLKSSSRSRIMGREAFAIAQKREDVQAKMIDLRDRPLPLCDGEACYGHPNVDLVRADIAEAQAILIALPIYNYGVSSAAKNLVEMTGRGAWDDKVVGFLCAAGGQSSYMSVLSFANGLMLDFRCVVVPRFVYATGAAFGESGIADAEVAGRVEKLVDAALRLIIP